MNQYTKKCYGIDDGLPQNSITDLAINTDGQLIVATYSGVVVFDGYRFSKFIPNTTKPFPNVEAFSLAVDKIGAIWIGTTSSGLYRINGENFDHWDTKNGLKSHIIRKIKVIDEGVLINNDEHVLFHDYETIDELRPFNNDTGDLLYSKFKNSNSRILQHKKNNNALYFSEKGQVFKQYDGKTQVLINNFNTSNPVSIYNLMKDKNDNLWISTIKNGLFRYGLNGLESFELLTTNRFSSAIEDLDGNIWVGTSSGLCSLTVGGIKNFGYEQGLFKENIKSLSVDHNDTVYAIPYGNNSQLIAINNNTVENLTLNLETKGSKIYEMTFDQNGQGWIATENYIGKITNNSIIEVLELNAITKVLISHKNALWFQENNNLVRYINKQKEFIPINQNNPVDIRSLSIAVNGDLLIGEKHNYYRLTASGLVRINIPIGISSCLKEIDEGEIWGCSDGLWLRKNKTNYHFDYQNSLTSVINGHIHDVQADKYGNIWAISNSGLFRLSRSDLDDFLTGRNNSPQFIKFSENDNIKSSEFNGSSSSSVISKNGKLWFASQGGVVNVNPELIFPESKKILKPFIENILIGEHYIGPYDLSMIQPNPKAIQIQFGAVFLADNRNIRFRHKLLPYHDEWHYGRIANIAELDPGTYQLVLQAQYNSNQWSQSLAKELTVVPAWYQTWVFRILFIFIIVILLIVIPQWRIKWLKKNRNELKKLVHNQTKSLTEANKKLDMLSRIDELTSIPNRREFINKINILCENPNSEFSLALIDIDDFKAYNDNYGHIAGDDCLIKVAKVIYGFTSESILTARFGGEEFIMLFEFTNQNGALNTLKDLHSSIANEQLTHQKSTVKSIISLSTGLVTRNSGESVESIIERADLAMYSAKTQGKDRIIVD